MFLKAVKLGIVLLSVSSMSCEHSTKINTLFYFKDERTGLCFASGGHIVNGLDSGSFTYVPCSSQVEEVIKLQQQK
jgi:hypothetical protein